MALHSSDLLRFCPTRPRDRSPVHARCAVHLSLSEKPVPNLNRFCASGSPLLLNRPSPKNFRLGRLFEFLGHEPGRTGGTNLGLPAELRRSLACTNIIENMNGTIRRVCANVKHWRDAAMALRWTGAAMLEAAKGFRRLKAHRQLPILKAALAAHAARHAFRPPVEQRIAAA